MCTVVVLIRPTFLLLAANRDERLDRPWDTPGDYWSAHPGTIAGRDRTAGGTWMGMNRHGLVATVLNRPGTLGPAPGKRSRGELPLIALDHPTVEAAAQAIAALDAGAWRSFNMVLADRTGAIFIRGLGHGRPTTESLPQGVSMVTACTTPTTWTAPAPPATYSTSRPPNRRARAIGKPGARFSRTAAASRPSS